MRKLDVKNLMSVALEKNIHIQHDVYNVVCRQKCRHVCVASRIIPAEFLSKAMFMPPSGLCPRNSRGDYYNHPHVLILYMVSIQPVFSLQNCKVLTILRMLDTSNYSLGL